MVIEAPRYEERVLFLGSNESGKSILAREMLGAGYHRVRAIDLKGDFDLLQEHRVVRDPGDWRGMRHRHIVYRPRPPYDTGPYLDMVLMRWYHQAQRSFDSKRKVQKDPTIIYVDETLALAHSRRTEALARIAVSGRALKLGLWCASQRPVWIPVETRSEAHRIYVFFLQYEDDEKEVLKYAKRQLSIDDLQASRRNWSFWELRRARDTAGRWEVRNMPPLPKEVALQ